MSDARDRILASVRDGLLRAVLPDSGAGASRRPLTPMPIASPDAMVDQFSAALTALAGRVHRAAALPDIADIVAGIAETHGATSYLSWDGEHLGCPGLLAALSSRGLVRVTYDVSGDPNRRAAEVGELGGAGLGLTGAHAALADSGAIVLLGGPGRGRLASLLPPVHVAIVSARRMRPSLQALIRAEPGLLDAGSSVVVVAGPSRTADIEMTLTHGVHGPKHVHVIVTT